VASRAMVSIGMVGILVIGFFEIDFTNRKICCTNALQKIWSRKDLLVITLFFWIVLASGLNSENKSDWMNWVRIKLPYLFLPIAFAGIQKISAKILTYLLYLFGVVMTTSAAIVLWRYFSIYDVVTNSFLVGGGIKMPYSHIRYSLMLVFAFFGCFYLLRKKLFVFNKNEKWLQISFMIFLFVSLHIFSVRSGLIALYVSLGYLLLKYIVSEKKYLSGVLLFSILLSIPVATYKFVPSFHNKIEFMLYDLERFGKGEVNTLNDAMRIVSIKTGWELTKQNLWFGTGAGDLHDEVFAYYKANHPDITEEFYRLPHNQFIWVLASTGIIGLAFFCVAFFVPLFINGNYKHWLFAVLYIIVFTSFFTEHTLEEQMGTGFYLLFLLLLMNYFHPAHE
jgi:O-antigen ligase